MGSPRPEPKAELFTCQQAILDGGRGVGGDIP